MIIDKTQFSDIKQLHRFIYENKSAIISAKKSAIKFSKSVKISNFDFLKTSSNKSMHIDPLQDDEEDKLFRRVVINTTNIFDSHKDLHLPGIWTKSLKENKNRKHLREHKSGFENVISDGEDLKAYVLDTTFKDLGFKKLNSTTQALIYESTIIKDRNEFMFNQYLKKWVKEHSVGMIYVKMDVAINDKSYKKEFDNYKKYIEMGVNPKSVEKDGYFFPIFEAKEIEGSAVVDGSNFATPTLEPKDIEPLFNTQKNEQSIDTQKRRRNIY